VFLFVSPLQAAALNGSSCANERKSLPPKKRLRVHPVKVLDCNTLLTGARPSPSRLFHSWHLKTNGVLRRFDDFCLLDVCSGINDQDSMPRAGLMHQARRYARPDNPRVRFFAGALCPKTYAVQSELRAEGGSTWGSPGYPRAPVTMQCRNSPIQ
jgi:hypothetical protein